MINLWGSIRISTHTFSPRCLKFLFPIFTFGQENINILASLVVGPLKFFCWSCTLYSKILEFPSICGFPYNFRVLILRHSKRAYLLIRNEIILNKALQCVIASIGSSKRPNVPIFHFLRINNLFCMPLIGLLELLKLGVVWWTMNSWMTK